MTAISLWGDVRSTSMFYSIIWNLIWWKGVHDALSQACIISCVFILPVCCWEGKEEPPKGSLSIFLLSSAYTLNKGCRQTDCYHINRMSSNLCETTKTTVWCVCGGAALHVSTHIFSNASWPWHSDTLTYKRGGDSFFSPFCLDKHTEAVKEMREGRWCEIGKSKKRENENYWFL